MFWKKKKRETFQNVDYCLPILQSVERLRQVKMCSVCEKPLMPAEIADVHSVKSGQTQFNIFQVYNVEIYLNMRLRYTYTHP